MDHLIISVKGTEAGGGLQEQPLNQGLRSDGLAALNSGWKWEREGRRGLNSHHWRGWTKMNCRT